MAQHEQRDDKYARESFSFRIMKRWQLWGISAVAVVVFIVAIFYGFA